jgi:hypothetical protein
MRSLAVANIEEVLRQDRPQRGSLLRCK